MMPSEKYYSFRLSSTLSEKVGEILGALKKTVPENLDDLNKLVHDSGAIVFYNADNSEHSQIIGQHKNGRFIALAQNEKNALNALENGAKDCILVSELDEFSLAKSLILAERMREIPHDTQLHESQHYEEPPVSLAEQKYTALLETTSLGVWQFDIEKNEIEWSESLYRILGYTGVDRAKPVPISDLARPEEREKIQKEILDHAVKGLPYKSEFRVEKKDGEYTWVRVEGNGIRNGKGEVVLILGSVKNINLRKQVEFDLNNTKSRIETIANGINGVMARHKIHADGKFENLYVSSGVNEMWGLSKKDVIANPHRIWNLLDQSEYELLESEFYKAVEENKKLDHVYSFTDKKGRLKFLHVIAIPKKFENGTIEWDSITTDVTAIKAVETESREQQVMLQNIISNLDGVVQRHKVYPDGKEELIYLSKAYEKISGIPVEEVKERYSLFWDQVIEEDRQRVIESVEESLSELTPWQQTWRILNRQGELKWLQASGTPHKQEDGSILFDTVTTEITQLKDITTELAESKQEFRLAAKAAQLGLWKFDPVHDILEWDAQMFKIFGIEPKDFTANRQAWVDSLHPDDRKKSVNALIDAVSNGSDLEFQFRIINKSNQEVRHIRASANSIVGKNGETVFLVGINWDVTHLMRAQEKLVESNHRYALASKATEDAIYDLNLQTNDLRWNESFNRLFDHKINLEKDHFSDWAHLLHPDDYDRVVVSLEKFLKTGKNKWEDRYRFKKGNGEYAHVNDRGFIVRDYQGTAIRMVGAMRDVTAHTEFIRAIKTQNEKLIKIAWKQSHELRGPLTRIMGLISLVEQDGFKDITMKEFFAYLNSAATELDQVIKEIVDSSEEVGTYQTEEQNILKK